MTKIHEVRRPIGQILWPGTHYSATHKIGIPLITRPFGQRQTMSIIDQLVNGIRALDIRIQQDHLVCSGNMLCDTTIGDVISDIKLFLEETEFEIVILEIQTEHGFCDPENFEDYLVEKFGDQLINQDDQVFSKSISEILPGRIICIWKPIINAFKPRQGGPIWSCRYVKCDKFDTQMPLTRFNGNRNNLKSRSAALKTNYFYKVENTLNPQTNTTLESLLVWPKYANVVSKRINGFARLFLAKCYKDGSLPRLQIYSLDFVDDDFISACIGLNQQEFNRPEMIHNPVGNMNISSSSYCNDINRKWDYNTSDNNNKTWARNVWICIPPKELKITSSEDREHWKPIESDEDNEVVELIEIYLLNVSGTYKMDELQQGIKHEAYFVVKMEDWAFGWESPVHLRLILPDGSTQENQQTLDLSSDDEVQYLGLGNFIMSPKMMGEMKFSLEQHGNTLKGGISIRDVCIQHVYNDIVVPRDLSIKFDDDDECWEWRDGWNTFTKSENEIVELESVRNCEVRGVFETRKLSFGCTYRVAFMIGLESEATGWENPTKLTLSLPNGSLQQRTENFKDLPTEEVIALYIGEFKMLTEMVGELQFSMTNNNEFEKTGLCILMAFIELLH